VLSGAFVGSKLLSRVSGRALRVTFVLVLAFVAIQMLVRGARG
jgi:uncharacterized membrane protein YfcA